MKNKSQGKLAARGVKIAPHERFTVQYFLDLGKDITLIPPSTNYKQKSPDFIMDGEEWEVKMPSSSRRQTLERCFTSAAHQSENVIIDLRKVKNSDAAINAIHTLERIFHNSHRVKRLKIIAKNNRLYEYR